MITGRGQLRRRPRAVRDALHGGRALAPRRTRRSSRSTRRPRKDAAGVHGVFTAEDLKLEAPLPMVWIPPGVEIKTPGDVAARQGRRQVRRPAGRRRGRQPTSTASSTPPSRSSSSYDPLPVVVDPEKALEAGSPLVHEEFGTNQTHEWTIGGGDMDAAWSDADVVIERRIVNHRTAGTPIEPRACVADFRAGALTLHLTSQNPHLDPPLHGRRVRHVRGRRSASSRQTSAAASA